MRAPKIYLETSVFNFVFANDSPDKRADTLVLFEEIRQGRFEPYTSAYVLEELELASEPNAPQVPHDHAALPKGSRLPGYGK